MIGFTLNDMGNMSPNIAEFCKVREQKGGKAWAYEFARPLPDDGSHPEVTQRLKGAFHSSDLWFVFKSLKHCWRPWTKGDWDGLPARRRIRSLWCSKSTIRTLRPPTLASLRLLLSRRASPSVVLVPPDVPLPLPEDKNIPLIIKAPPE